MLTADLTTIPRPNTPVKVLSPLGIREGTTVSIPWLDARTATIPNLSMYDPKLRFLADWDNWRDKTLAVALRIRYVWPGIGKKLAFFGPIHTPDFDYETGKVTINARDPSLRMQSGFVVRGDDLISPGYSIDGRGAQMIVNAAQNRPNQDDLNWPSLGINIGFDTSTRNAGQRRTCSPGDQLWQTLQELGQLQIGPDWELEPVETDPTNIASGPATDNSDQAIAAGVNDYTINVGLPGIVEGFRVGVYITHDKPSDLELRLVSPLGTVIDLYLGGSDRNTDVTGGPAFGTAEAALCYFADFGNWPYGTTLNPSTWPKTGRMKSDDPILSQIVDQDAAGVWTLRITDTGGTASGTLRAWSLRFQLPEPAYVRLNTMDKPPENPGFDAKFHDGEGPRNAKIKISPLGEHAINWSRFGSAKGGRQKIRENSIARDEIGTYENYTTTDQNDSNAVLAALADREVKAYSLPAPALSIKPDADRGQNNLPRLLFNYKPGGHVLGIAKRGYFRHRVLARVTSGQLTNSGGTVATGLSVIPVVGMTEDIADG